MHAHSTQRRWAGEYLRAEQATWKGLLMSRWNLSPQTVTNGSTTDIISWGPGKSSCVRPTRDASRRVIIGCLWPIGTFFKAMVRQPKQTVGFFRLERRKHIPVTTIMVFWAQWVKCWWYGKTPSLQSYAYFSYPFSLIVFSYEKIPCLPKMSSFSFSVIILFSSGFLFVEEVRMVRVLSHKRQPEVMGGQTLRGQFRPK